jgi:hypothetical protein
MTCSNRKVIDQFGTAGLELLLHLGREVVERRAEVLREEHAVRVAPLEQREHGRLALLGRQEDVEARSGPCRSSSRCRAALDVVEVVGVAGVGDLDLARVDALLAKIRICSGRSAAGREWAMIGAPVLERAAPPRGGPSRRSA